MTKKLMLLSLLLFVVTGCSRGLLGKVDSLYWYQKYGIQKKEDIAKAESVPNLIEALKDDNYRIAIYAARYLGRIGPGAKKSIPALIETAKSDRYLRVRTNSIKSLWAIDKENPEIINCKNQALPGQSAPLRN